jgi:hypothetical protein
MWFFYSRAPDTMSIISVFKFISPSHKRTEGRAPVWGSEFTTKVATLQGDSVDIALQGNSAEIAATLNIKLWDSVVAD